MKRYEVENWARRSIQRARAGHGREDAVVELKREWPTDHKRAAGQIGALANAARMENVLWIIGIDESGSLAGAKGEDLSAWWAAVSRFFDGAKPLLVDAAFDVESVGVVALGFETIQPPYVITNPDGGIISYWVPWRDGTRTRAANRQELLTMLVASGRVPSLTPLDCEVIFNTSTGALSIRMHVYVVPADTQPVTIPRHLCDVEVEFQESSWGTLPLVVDEFGGDRDATHASFDQCYVSRPGPVLLTTAVNLPTTMTTLYPQDVLVRARVGFAGLDRMVQVEFRFHGWQLKDGFVRWKRRH